MSTPVIQPSAPFTQPVEGTDLFEVVRPVPALLVQKAGGFAWFWHVQGGFFEASGLQVRASKFTKFKRRTYQKGRKWVDVKVDLSEFDLYESVIEFKNPDRSSTQIVLFVPKNPDWVAPQQ